MDWTDQSAICSQLEQDFLQSNSVLISPLYSPLSYEAPPLFPHVSESIGDNTKVINSDGPNSAYLFDPNPSSKLEEKVSLLDHVKLFGGNFLHDLFYSTIINMSLTILGEVMIDHTPGASNHLPAIIYGSSIGIFKGTMTVMHLEDFKKLCLETESYIHDNYFQPQQFLESLGFSKEAISWMNAVFMDELAVLLFQAGVVKYQDSLTDFKLAYYLDADDAKILHAQAQKYPERLVKNILRRLIKDCSKGLYDRLFDGLDDYTGVDLKFASAPLADMTKYFASDFILSSSPNPKLIIVSSVVKAGAEYIYKTYLKEPVNSTVDDTMGSAHGSEITKATISGAFISALYTLSKELTNGNKAMEKLTQVMVTAATSLWSSAKTFLQW